MEYRKIIEPFEMVNEWIEGKNLGKLKKIKEKCKMKSKILTQLDILKDNECKAEWFHYLYTGKIIGIDEMFGFFEKNKLCGIIVEFEDGRKAIYKSCGAYNEFPEGEVLSSLLDHTMGSQNFVAPSVTREISVDEIRKILEDTQGSVNIFDYRFTILDQLKNTCAFKNKTMFIGSMIGWWDGLKKNPTFHKYAKTDEIKEKILELKYGTSEYIDRVTEGVTKNHAFYYLLQFFSSVGHNEFSVYHNQKLINIAIDLDRANFFDNERNVNGLSVCIICKISKRYFETLQNFNQRNNLGQIIQSVSYQYPFFNLKLPNIFANNINERVFDLCQCFEQCISEYGKQNVLLY
eukprot:TRINITY_DN1323_c0_g1_i3.p1 TRINITY_DN1323_c0_g1~~TRINITY_DN1323_c0_g1_i3.p1  ORF type:complete len:348 (+),score=64.32 TRINITY_DN1323_c0_g1_i3:531-1574(+)